MKRLLPELEKVISIMIIQNDAESIYSILETERDTVFAMEIIPYLALFIKECQNYMGGDFLPDSINLKITDIRNHIKLYSERYSKSEKKVESIDNQQNELFKSQLRYNFLKNINIHFNIGTYWIDGHIIGNTQQIASFLGLDSLDDKDNAGKKQYELAYQIGSFIAFIREGLSKEITPPEIIRNKTGISINKFGDFNTNTDKGFFKDKSNKELNILLLNLLCTMNFVKYVLSKLFDEDNYWLFRIEYIVTYYTFRAIEKVKNQLENNKKIQLDKDEINTILDAGTGLFVSKFRNCMMHYNLENENVLSEDYIDNQMFGLVENCFEGLNYKVYRARLREYLNLMINYVEGKFDYSKINLKDLK